MEKQKRWQFYLILTVIVLTLYNILPTIFFYTKPLKSPVDAQMAKEISHTIIERVDSLEEESKAWLESFAQLLGVKPSSIALHPNNAGLIEVDFANAKEAELFKLFLPRAGALIPFVPAQLGLYPTILDNNANKVLVSRQINIHLDPKESDQLFHFTPKYSADGEITPMYRNFVYDRMAQLALAIGGPSKTAIQLAAIVDNKTDAQYDDLVLNVAQEILSVDSAFGKDSPIAQRFYASFTQIDHQGDLLQQFLARIETLKVSLATQRDALIKELDVQKQKQELVEASKEERATLLEKQLQTLEAATIAIQKNLAAFKRGVAPFTLEEIHTLLTKGVAAIGERQTLNLEGRNPFVEALVLDPDFQKISLKFYPDVLAVRSSEEKSESTALQKERLHQLIINEIARVSRQADEIISPSDEAFAVTLDNLTNTQSLLALDLGYLADKQSQQIVEQLRSAWQPTHPDLASGAFPILSYQEYQALSPEDQQLGLVVYAPAASKEVPPMGFRTGSIYVVARGLDAIMQKYKQMANTPEAQALAKEIENLNALLQQQNFIGYPGSSYGIDPAYRKDYIYELDDYYSNLLKATREDFIVKGSKRYAALDFTDVEQRIITENRIEDRQQEDLLKWKEEYNASQVSLDATNRYLVPAPTENVYWENLKLSFVKYFRGDDRKVLKWGLDLSGGKTVRIGLYDRNNRAVTNQDDLRQAVNELYNRVNAMGVSERTIRIEGNNIILDFPGSQALSAAELIKASAMYFHIVNEKFSTGNPDLRERVNQFLQNVWNEAVVTNRKDIESINAIAWQHLGGDSTEYGAMRPISDYAKDLYNSGLRLANPNDATASSSFDDTLSSIAMLRGDDFSEWGGQTHPLLVIFHNYALEGSSLTNVQVGYDPSQGNLLSFSVKRSFDGAQRSGSPRDDFYTWTSQFAEDKIAGTPKEAYSHGYGWRMAVILNGKVISAPVLRAALRDGGTISGHFSPREVNQLAADLKAGSLSFTPRILSEENVSPELGLEERTQGIIAAVVALALVVIAMVSFYHFAGVVASCAVLFNIFVMWGVLQNLGAALTLPGIAGIVLTIGMAVDANVLVFERIREEFSLSGRIASAIQAGYRKAFSAIIDSNVTTIIAAFVLIQFDSGPIKGFAVNLIIGIISSMFTTLFMTRYFFAGWVQNPNNKSLKMSQLIGKTNFDFLKQARKAIIVTLIVIGVGTYFFVAQHKTLFGMDFTGGYALNVELAEQPGIESYRIKTMDALLANGATSNDVQIRELSQPNHLRIQLGVSMEEKGHPFYQLPEVLTEGKFKYGYQANPRIAWVVNALESANLHIAPSELNRLEADWTVVSGQLSDSMRNNAIMALSIALVCILIYLTIRFEFKYAISAIIGLTHDVIITIGILAILNKIGVPVQIDLQVIGAIMMIIGYSLNDTIIVFDRIREDVHLMRKMSFSEIINHALNVTLARTIMTSGTTMLVLLTLVLLGGKSIFAFSLVMLIGVIVGTTSSWFIAAPVLLYFHNRDERQQQLASTEKTS